jgi:HEAT repeat protein
MTLELVVGDLGNAEGPIRHTDLVQLSGLPRSQVPDVISTLSSSPAERRRELIDRMTELAEHNIELDFTAVLRACLRDRDPEVRAKAVHGLWDSEDRTIVRPLIDLLLNDQSSSVRESAAGTLAKFAELAGEGKLVRRDAERISDALLSVVDRPDEDIETRRRAIEAVASFDSDQVRSIIEGAYSDSDPRLRQSAIFAMGRSSDARWLPTVIKEMRNPDAGVRFEAATACGLLGEDDTLPYLISLLNDEDGQVQLAAVRALGGIGGDLARRALAEAMKRGDDAIEEAAEEALASIEFDADPLGFRYEG